MIDTLAINEIFGPTIQGEGPHAGRLSTFVRLYGCNLDCAWCDTPYTWDANGKNGTPHTITDERHLLPIEEVFAQAFTTGAPNLVITGGEPLIQTHAVTQLTVAWYDMDGTVEIETNGTRPPLNPQHSYDRPHYNISPKLPGSGVNPLHAIRPATLKQFTEELSYAFKFVITNEQDITAVELIAEHVQIPPNRIWLMPEGIMREAVITTGSWVADAAIKHGYNFTTRLHVLAWGNQRAR